jgi:hypothetical protein
MAKYAEDTQVTADRSRTEIERTLQRYGADGFMYGWEGNRAVVAFRAHGKMLRFIVPLPERDSTEFARTPTSRRRTANSEQEAYEQAVRQRWRPLALVIKAKLEAVESGIEAFEQAFLANILLPDGQTVGQWLVPQVEQAYLTGTMPALLPLLPERAGE